MLNYTTITPADVAAMPYVDFIALLQETNRCPGGKATIRDILHNSFVSENSYVLEVGSNTGFSSLEVARSAKCRVLGIDPVASAVAQSNSLLAQDNEIIQKLVRFKVGSAYDIPAEDNSFDLIIAGGATSFMDEKEKAVSEYWRVLKPWSFLSISNFYYFEEPPTTLIEEISTLLGVQIRPWTKKQWGSLFHRDGSFEEYYSYDRQLKVCTDEELHNYVEFFLQKPHIAQLEEPIKAAINKRWCETLKVFNENHKYAGFQVVLFRKALMEEEPQIFVTK